MGAMNAQGPLVEPLAELSAEEIHRYSRHLIIPNVGVDGQRRLKSARILIVGAGGLGSPALMYLAAAGVGTIGIVDFDRVDLSNLQRQVIHRQSDLGRPKVDSARDAVLEINPLVHVTTHELQLDPSNVIELFSQYDVIVDGTDNFASRYLINDAAVLLGKPVVWGSIYRFDGQASVFWAANGPCYRCLFPEPPAAGTVPSCAEGGVLGVLCASIGSIQVTEVIKLITGIGEPLIGRLVIYDALEMKFREITVTKDPDCSICGTKPTHGLLDDYQLFCGVAPAVAGQSITVQELKSMIDAQSPFTLVDVREPGEFEIVSIPGAVLIPQQTLLSGQAHHQLPLDQPIVLYCRSGIRSARCQEALEQAGLTNAFNLTGGVLAWAQEIDTSLPVY